MCRAVGPLIRRCHERLRTRVPPRVMGRATGGLALVRAALDFGAAAVGVVIRAKGSAQVQTEMRETVVAVGRRSTSA